MPESGDPDRRPIGARRLRVFQSMSEALARAGISANGISVAGMICGLGAGACLAATDVRPGERMWFWLAAGALVWVRLLANMLDGMVALASGTASRVGELYNEVPDRVSDTAALAGLGYAFGGSAVAGWAAALAAMFTAYVRATGKSAGAKNDFSGPLAKPQRMWIVSGVAFWSAFAPAEWQWIENPGMWLAEAAAWLIAAGSLLTALRRLVRIGRALRNPSP
jgi:phosphatidylglycerophosphate synthase